MDWLKWKFTETMRCPANARISRWGWGWHCRPSCVFFSTLFQEHSSLEILIRGSDGIERFLVKSPMNLSRFGEIPMVFAVILHILSRSLSRWYFDGPITILAQKKRLMVTGQFFELPPPSFSTSPRCCIWAICSWHLWDHPRAGKRSPTFFTSPEIRGIDSEIRG